MVEAGVMDGVDYVIGLHVMSGLESGKIGIAYGPMMAAPDVFTVEIQGKGDMRRGRKKPIAIGRRLLQIYNISYQEIQVLSCKESFQLRSFMGNG